MTKQEWQQLNPMDRPTPKNRLTGGSEITNDEISQRIREQLKMSKATDQTRDFLNNNEPGIKPLPMEKFFKLKLFNRYIYNDSTYDRFIEMSKLFGAAEGFDKYQPSK